MSINVCTRAEKDAIADADRRLPVHHRVRQDAVPAGPARHRRAPRRHAAQVPPAGGDRWPRPGLLKVICGTDTLGVGINVPIRTVLFTALTKYDGIATRLLKAREFHQIAGRAGRAGFDTAGTVVVQAPEHVVENEKALAKAGDDPKKRRKVVRKKPPEGFVGWGEPTFERLVAAEPEPLTSSFKVSHSMLLNVIARPGDAFAAMRHLLDRQPRGPGRPSAGTSAGPSPSTGRCWPAASSSGWREPDAEGRRARLTVDLQPDFALNQPLSPFALAAIELLDRESPTYALDVVSVDRVDPGRPAAGAVRAAVQGPRRGGRADEGGRHRVRRADGAARRGHLPEAAGGAAARPRTRSTGAGHPWVADHELWPQVGGPRHVRAGDDLRRVRRGSTGWPASEGLVLRYLADAYKALRQTVPGRGQDRGADRPHRVARRAGPPGRLQPARRVGAAAPTRAGRRRRHGPAVEDGPPPVTAQRPRLPGAGAQRAVPPGRAGRARPLRGRSASSTPRTAGTPTRWAAALEPYFDEHDEIGTGPDARGPALLHHRRAAAAAGRVRQIFDDPAGDHDWGITAEVDLAASDEAGEAVVRVTDVGQL